MNITRLHIAAVCAALSFSTLCRADVSLPSIISDNMVLQKGKAAVWGKADPKEKVTVKIAGKSATATAGDDGAWSVKLDALKSGGPFEMTVAGKNTITIKNVVIGEVWVASGQSNMEFRVSGVNDVDKEVADAKFPMIRMFTVARKIADEPQGDCGGTWEVCAPDTVKGFSAVGYFFARELHRKLKVPVGVIHSSWGGTPAEAWTPKAALEGDEELKPILDNWKASVENFPKTKADYETKLAAWKDQSEKDKAEGKKPALAPREPAAPETNPRKPSGLFNGMIAPIVPYAIRGAIWYQGEANAGRAAEYRKLFPTMIESWRKAWGSQFPFGFVQLANYMKRNDEPGDSNWALLREAQTMTLRLPKTGMAVIIDIGDEKNIHPKDKQDVGLRLALWAESSVYESGGIASSPLFSSMKISGDKATITFKHANGLVAKDGPLKGFAIAGDDMKFAWADAKIVSSQVVVQSPAVPKPVAVRYAWADNPECNLYSKDGLPASPFRTDDWEHTLFMIAPPTPAAEAAPAATPAPKPSATPKKKRGKKAAKETPAPSNDPLQSEQSSRDLLKKPAGDTQEPEKK